MVDPNQREPGLNKTPGAAEQTDKNAAATAAATAVAKPRRSRTSRWLRGIGFVLLTLLLVLALALSGFWWWTGRDDSLAYTLQKVARFLPEGQTLEAKEVSGSLRQGGRIGWLQWQSPTMKVEVKEADIGWSLPPLLSRKLELGKVHIAELEIASAPNPDKTPTEPLQQLTLPLQLDVPFEVDRIIWQGPPQALVEGLKGHYSYDGSEHKLAVNNVQWADGRYDANLVLQGASPMRLKAEVNGQVQAPNPLQAAKAETATEDKEDKKDKEQQASSAAAQAPVKSGPTIAVVAKLKAEGTLATEAALLQISAHVSAQPEAASDAEAIEGKNGSLSSDDGFKKLSKEKQKTARTDTKAGANASAKANEAAAGMPVNMQAELLASVAPWKPQPLLSATADLRDLDVAAFWPQGPRTLLNGQLSAGPLMDSVAAASNENAIKLEAKNAAATGSEELKDTQWQLAVLLDNAMPGPWDKRRLPVRHLQSQVQFDGQRWQVLQSHVDIGKGLVELAGYYDTQTALFEGKADVKQLNPADLYSSLEAAPLQGSLSAVAKAVEPKAEGAAGADVVAAAEVPGKLTDKAAEKAADKAPAPAIEFEVDLKAAGGVTKANSKLLRIQTLAAKGQWLQPVLNLSHLELEALQASVNGKDLAYNLDKQQGRGSIKAQVPGAKLDVAGEMSAETGKGQAALQLASMETLAQWLRKLPGVGDPLAGAQLHGKADAQIDWNGGWGKLVQRLQAKRGQELPASGLQIKARLTAQQLRYLAAGGAAEQAIVVPALELQLDGSPENASLKLKAQAQQQAQSVQLDTALQAGLASAKGAAALDWQASIERLQAQLLLGKDRPGPWVVQLLNNTGTSATGGALRLEQRTTGNTVLSTNLSLSAARLQLTPPALGQRRTSAEALSPVQISWSDSQAIKTGDGSWALKSAGQLLGLPISWVDAFSFGEEEPPLAAMGLSGDLSFNGQWDVDTTGKALKALLKVERAGGDLRLAVEDGEGTTVTRTSGPRSTAPGQVRTSKVSGAGMRARIKDARLTVQAQGEEVTAQLLWDSERAGTATAQLRTRLAQVNGNWTLPEKAPLSGQVEAKMPDIGIWALFAPPGWRIKGSLQAQANISGDIQTPQWQGTLSADDLTIASILDGVDLQQGVLRANLQSNRVDITELRFKGGKGSSTRVLGYSGNLTNAPEDGGELTGSGFAQWSSAAGEGQSQGLSMSLQAKASKLQVLVRADRQVSVSGDLGANLNNGQFVLRGDLTVDRATIILPEETAPSLDKDVVVRTAASRKAEEEAAKKQKRETEKANAKAETRKLPDILVKLDLGRDFALQGFGITTRLRGQLEVQGASVAGGPPRITGEVRTEQGRYRAWGQSLDVESGIIRFNGPYNNPSLDILAIRPNIAVRAGVQVLGTATAPRVRLYSDPDLPDAEKLSWVVMGRDPSTGGAESALLQQAALALLSGGGGGGTGKIANSLGLDEVGFKGGGDGNGASGAALTMGKRISSKLYLTYEQSLSGAMGTIFIFYDLSRRLTLRAQTGVTSALDLIYTIRKD